MSLAVALGGAGELAVDLQRLLAVGHPFAVDQTEGHFAYLFEVGGRWGDARFRARDRRWRRRWSGGGRGGGLLGVGRLRVFGGGLAVAAVAGLAMGVAVRLAVVGGGPVGGVRGPRSVVGDALGMCLMVVFAGCGGAAGALGGVSRLAHVRPPGARMAVGSAMDGTGAHGVGAHRVGEGGGGEGDGAGRESDAGGERS